MHCYNYSILLIPLFYLGKVSLTSRDTEKQSSLASGVFNLRYLKSFKVSSNAERKIVKIKRVYRPESAFVFNYRHWIKQDGECQDHMLGR